MCIATVRMLMCLPKQSCRVSESCMHMQQNPDDLGSGLTAVLLLVYFDVQHS